MAVSSNSLHMARMILMIDLLVHLLAMESRQVSVKARISIVLQVEDTVAVMTTIRADAKSITKGAHTAVRTKMTMDDSLKDSTVARIPRADKVDVSKVKVNLVTDADTMEKVDPVVSRVDSADKEVTDAKSKEKDTADKRVDVTITNKRTTLAGTKARTTAAPNMERRDVTSPMVDDNNKVVITMKVVDKKLGTAVRISKVGTEFGHQMITDHKAMISFPVLSSMHLQLDLRTMPRCIHQPCSTLNRTIRTTAILTSSR